MTGEQATQVLCLLADIISTLETIETNVQAKYYASMGQTIGDSALTTVELEDNSTGTDPSAYVKVNGTTTNQGSFGFTVSTTGVITYTGTRNIRAFVSIGGSATMSSVSGNPDLRFQIVKNSTPIASRLTNALVETQYTSAGARAFCAKGTFDLVPGDTIEVYAACSVALAGRATRVRVLAVSVQEV